MADQNLDLFAATTDIEDTDLIQVYKKSSDSVWRKMTGASLRAFPLASVMRGHISGLTLSNNGTDSDHDIDIATGACSFTDGTDYALFALSSGLTKQVDANWAEGNNAGGFPSGLTLSNSTTYHVFVIAKNDGTIDAGFDTSLTAANLLTDAGSYTWYRRIGSLYTDGSSNWVSFKQINDEFMITPVNDVQNSNPGTTSVTEAISVPTGINLLANISFGIRDTSPTGRRVSAIVKTPLTTTPAPSVTINTIRTSDINDASGVSEAHTMALVRTSTSGEIRYRLDTSDAAIIANSTTYGWFDDRGQNG